MVHVAVDISPISVETEYRYVEVEIPQKTQRQQKRTTTLTERRWVVYVHNEPVYFYPWSRDLYSDEEDTLLEEWKYKWEQFQAESFTRWINESREEEQEAGNSGD